SGTGFGASLPISFYLDDALTSIPATNTSSLGSFTSNFTIPPTSYGSHTLKAQDSGGGSATATFTASQTMTINPQTGNSGSSVTISGSGFGANKNINITYDGANVVPSPATVIADASGNFNITMTVPPSGGGTHSIAASDGTISATANFTIVATSNITASKGTVDSSVSLSGSGFFARGTVTIRWDNAQVAQVTADAGGVFSASIKVPPSKTGDHAITVTDGTTSKTFTFTVTASASLKESAGYVGGDISMSGSGFGAGAAITITYDGNKMATAAADASGSFTAVFKAPVSKGGSHIIAATDGTSTINTTFTMDTTPPPVPPVLQPPDKTQADSQPNFVWTEVSDPSGVTYTFQLATDSNFNTIVLARNLTNPGFKLTEKENLPSRSAQEPYYWRVKAVDDASNESDWSPAYQFFVGFIMPAWGLYVIFGFVTLLIGLGAFWLGRRTSYRWDW
ncbi:MAG: hypothetical protein Q8O16_05455, partial [Dehalococcoidia bacterium]|nr:hypothetical protein [Dehalococcoidia bacterium]